MFIPATKGTSYLPGKCFATNIASHIFMSVLIGLSLPRVLYY
jgi:hypothetical protein